MKQLGLKTVVLTFATPVKVNNNPHGYGSPIAMTIKR